jgi:hypothetical protein
MQYLSFIYFITHPLHVSGIFIAHHQEVFTVYVQQLVCVICYVKLAAGWVRVEQFSPDLASSDST